METVKLWSPWGAGLLTWQVEGCLVLPTAAITLTGDTRAAHQEVYSRGPETSPWGVREAVCSAVRREREHLTHRQMVKAC